MAEVYEAQIRDDAGRAVVAGIKASLSFPWVVRHLQEVPLVVEDVKGRHALMDLKDAKKKFELGGMDVMLAAIFTTKRNLYEKINTWSKDFGLAVADTLEAEFGSRKRELDEEMKSLAAMISASSEGDVASFEKAVDQCSNDGIEAFRRLLASTDTISEESIRTIIGEFETIENDILKAWRPAGRMGGNGSPDGRTNDMMFVATRMKEDLTLLKHLTFGKLGELDKEVAMMIDEFEMDFDNGMIDECLDSGPGIFEKAIKSLRNEMIEDTYKILRKEILMDMMAPTRARLELARSLRYMHAGEVRTCDLTRLAPHSFDIVEKYLRKSLGVYLKEKCRVKEIGFSIGSGVITNHKLDKVIDEAAKKLRFFNFARDLSAELFEALDGVARCSFLGAQSVCEEDMVGEIGKGEFGFGEESDLKEAAFSFSCDCPGLGSTFQFSMTPLDFGAHVVVSHRPLVSRGEYAAESFPAKAKERLEKALGGKLSPKA